MSVVTASQRRVGLTLMGPTPADQSHYAGIDLDTALDYLDCSHIATSAVVSVAGSLDTVRDALLALGASDE